MSWEMNSRRIVKNAQWTHYKRVGWYSRDTLHKAEAMNSTKILKQQEKRPFGYIYIYIYVYESRHVLLLWRRDVKCVKLYVRIYYADPRHHGVVLKGRVFHFFFIARGCESTEWIGIVHCGMQWFCGRNFVNQLKTIDSTRNLPMYWGHRFPDFWHWQHLYKLWNVESILKDVTISMRILTGWFAKTWVLLPCFKCHSIETWWGRFRSVNYLEHLAQMSTFWKKILLIFVNT
jgi:hypothetical protein